MLLQASEGFVNAWAGPQDEDLRHLLQNLRQVTVTDNPHHVWARLVVLDRIENLVAALKLDHIKVLHQLDARDPYGVSTSTDHLTGGLHMRPGAAYAQLCNAKELCEFPKLDLAVHHGWVSPEATGVIVQTLKRVRKHCPERVSDVEFEMLCAAEEKDHEELRRHGTKIFHLLDGTAARKAQDQERERRSFDLRRLQNGWFQCNGYLEPVGGTLFQLALKAVSGSYERGDERSPAQRRADALTELAEHRLDYGDLPEHGQEKPHLTIVAHAETLRGEDGSPAATIDWGTPVCGETAKRLACDALARIALVGDRGDGIVDILHMGRAIRTTNLAQRKALDLQDGGCLWPGCPHHVKDTTPHHWDAWATGGRSDHENLGLVCKRHHYSLHEGGYRAAEVSPERVVILRSDGSEYGTVARHRLRRIPIRGS
ncbi:MAG: DUF222 domain-containing protein [Candidatus Dormibacteraceae bacterium]